MKTPVGFACQTQAWSSECQGKCCLGRRGSRPGRLHDLRHTSPTHLLTAGVPVHIVAARLGHSSPMVTLSTYAHVLPRSDEQAAEVMAAVLAGGAG